MEYHNVYTLIKVETLRDRSLQNFARFIRSRKAAQQHTIQREMANASVLTGLCMIC